MRRIHAALALLLALALAGCAGPEPETPQQGIEAIVRLYEAGDFDTLVRTRYAEIGKAESEEQVQQLVDRFATRFADDAARAEAVATYRSALQVAPALSDDGTSARFDLGEGFVRLSRMSDEKWGFHL